jgi:single-stranded DNA-binding protein
VEGRLQTRSWENDQGFRQFRTDVVANEITILDPRHSSESHEEANAHPEHNEEDEMVLGDSA